MAHALRDLQRVGPLLDQQARVRVAQVVGPERLGEPSTDERGPDDVVTEHRHFEAARALDGMEQGSGRCPADRVAVTIRRR